MEKEKVLVLELARVFDFKKDIIQSLLEQVRDYPRLLGWITYNRMGGPACYVLQRCGLLSKMNREVRNVLIAIYNMNLLQQGLFASNLAYLAQLFQNASFPYAFLKGAYLSTCIYPRGLRTSNDFDVLVQRDDIGKCERLLLENGFIQGKYLADTDTIQKAGRREIIASRMNRGETVPFLKRRQGKILEVDINFSLDYKAKTQRDIIPDLLSDPLTFPAGDGRLYALSEVKCLLQLCLHLYKEATVYNWVEMGRDLCLYKFMDIYAFLLKKDGTFLRAFADKALTYGLEEGCYYAIYNTAQLYPSLLEKPSVRDALERLRPRRLDYMKQIVYPEGGKRFQYDDDFTDWFFAPDRCARLREIPAE